MTEVLLPSNWASFSSRGIADAATNCIGRPVPQSFDFQRLATSGSKMSCSPYARHEDWYENEKRRVGLPSPGFSVNHDRPSQVGRAYGSVQQNSYYRPTASSSASSTRQSDPATFQRRPDSPLINLPPLKSILAENNLSSPPTTPGSAHSFQPPTLEPSYDLNNHRPVGLYPSKKSCTDDYWTGRTGPSSPESLTAIAPRSIGSPHARRDSAARSMTGSSASRDSDAGLEQKPWNYAVHSQMPESFCDRRPTTLPPPRPTQAGTSLAQYAESGLRIRDPQASPSYPRRSMYSSNHSSISWSQTAREDLRMRSPSVDMSNGRGFIRTSTGYSHPAQHENEEHRPHGNTVTMAPGPSQSHGYYPARPQTAGSAYTSFSAAHEPVVCHATPPYEYQGAKSRKRSNLPKQSTEIMKRWFDDHIDNPYPSEEQKKYFAAKANINLTQVSNWFINHRRRCPELNDKREKSRSSSRGDDY